MLRRALLCTLVGTTLGLGAGCEGTLDLDLDEAVGTFVLKCVAGKDLPDVLFLDTLDLDTLDLDVFGLDVRDRDGFRDCDDRRFRDRRFRDRRDRDDDRFDIGRLIDVTAEFEIRIVHETIRLRPGGTGTITSVVNLFLIETGEVDGRRIITRDILFVIDDDRIEIVDVCPSEIDCVFPRALVMRREPSWVRDQLYQAFSPFGGPALLYVRVSPVSTVPEEE